MRRLQGSRIFPLASGKWLLFLPTFMKKSPVMAQKFLKPDAWMANVILVLVFN
ncbi:hypothetical protein Q8A64_03585 [Oxalobacteraceae bacterium R-40]|uniref:Uncharacterized protein n=1 Tax=Keguizhuia sedimenti TaxID=3064264 RepID=A0ABU1BMY4_9BURK|nr:hypothetical protein [Oxalobacteraceae bacterium R-40]